MLRDSSYICKTIYITSDDLDYISDDRGEQARQPSPTAPGHKESQPPPCAGWCEGWHQKTGRHVFHARGLVSRALLHESRLVAWPPRSVTGRAAPNKQGSESRNAKIRAFPGRRIFFHGYEYLGSEGEADKGRLRQPQEGARCPFCVSIHAGHALDRCSEK
jgi:hypothetical protein